MSNFLQSLLMLLTNIQKSFGDKLCICVVFNTSMRFSIFSINKIFLTIKSCLIFTSLFCLPNAIMYYIKMLWCPVLDIILDRSILNSSAVIKRLMTSCLPVNQMTSRLAVTLRCPPSRRSRLRKWPSLASIGGEGVIAGTAPLRQRRTGRPQPTHLRPRLSFPSSLFWLATVNLTTTIGCLSCQLRSGGWKRLQCGSRVRRETRQSPALQDTRRVTALSILF